MDDCLGCHDTVGSRVSLDHLELYRSHTSTSNKYISLLQWPIRLQEVRLEEYFE